MVNNKQRISKGIYLFPWNMGLIIYFFQYIKQKKWMFEKITQVSLFLVTASTSTTSSTFEFTSLRANIWFRVTVRYTWSFTEMFARFSGFTFTWNSNVLVKLCENFEVIVNNVTYLALRRYFYQWEPSKPTDQRLRFHHRLSRSWHEL